MYKDFEKRKNEYLIKSGFFNCDKGNGVFNGKKYPYVLEHNENNFYMPIYNEVIDYFNKFAITWWGENKSKPSCHTLSSQISCLNHLFYIRRNRFLCLHVLNFITNRNFIDVISFENYINDNGYIAFEISNYKEPYVSVNALFLAKDKENKKHIIMIEWKYTEDHSDEDFSINKYEKILNEYFYLINNSKQLKMKYFNYKSSIYFQGELYKLTRQTLWAEQMIENKYNEKIEADDFLHIVVIPNKNKSILSSRYKISNMNLEDTWRNVLNDNSKFMIIDNKKIIEALEYITELIKYGLIDSSLIVSHKNINVMSNSSKLSNKKNNSVESHISSEDIVVSEEDIYDLEDFVKYLKIRY
ncbi:hypothetical protein A966_07414 [Brachyspira hampsonii 30446]|uniref:Uncharacterized protein n=4 Tax=Brachyspira hampsonii TaxID=1287055 RepID=A0A2U4EVH6_9SPIR|nr:hypothetical protein [Brachyspira hampsonii]EKV56848.1 hypothetical protein A966_07414 [Brachyspira hampsonii 30446]